jgi:hypothetical protein
MPRPVPSYRRTHAGRLHSLMDMTGRPATFDVTTQNGAIGIAPAEAGRVVVQGAARRS